jgi:hypothetical protein
MRYQRGASVVAYNAKRNAANITAAVRENFKAAGVWLSRGLSRVLGVRCPSEKYCAEQKRKKPYIRGDGEKKKAKSLAKKRAPRWDSNPRGCEQGIGPAQQRTGRHEPSSCACDRGHKSYKHQDRRWAICKEAKRGDQGDKMPKGTAATARAKGGVEGWRT